MPQLSKQQSKTALVLKGDTGVTQIRDEESVQAETSD